MSKSKKTLNETEWIKIFNKYKIINKIAKDGFFIITSKQINPFRQSRLMTKIDHSINLPKIFKDNNLSILPLTRGSYIITEFQAYETLKYPQKATSVIIPKRNDLESIDYNNIYSEAAALHCAFTSGIIKDLLEEDNELTVSGRMSSSSFEFFVNPLSSIGEKRKINVVKSQCEIDAGFESETKLALIETKNAICDDFLIRQIYYPYRLWKDKVSKKVIPIFMIYSNGVFSFYVYRFKDPNNYNSLELVEQKNYMFESDPINLEIIKEIYKKTTLVKESKVPFPQADVFFRVIDLLGLLVNEDLSKQYITSNYDFNERQTKYYTDAGKYLDLIEQYKDENKEIIYTLTNEGRKIMLLPLRERHLAFVNKILSHKAFRECFKNYLRNSEIPSLKQVVKIMKRSNLQGIKSDETFYRRAQSVVKWVDWILSLNDE